MTILALKKSSPGWELEHELKASAQLRLPDGGLLIHQGTRDWQLTYHCPQGEARVFSPIILCLDFVREGRVHREQLVLSTPETPSTHVIDGYVLELQRVAANGALSLRLKPIAQLS
jgi:hypothetical protein